MHFFVCSDLETWNFGGKLLIWVSKKYLLIQRLQSIRFSRMIPLGAIISQVPNLSLFRPYTNHILMIFPQLILFFRTKKNEIDEIENCDLAGVASSLQ